MSALTLSWFSFVLYFYFLIHSTFQGNAVSGSTRGARGAMSRRDTGLYALGERTHRPAKVPSLLVASLDELSAGLEAGEFTSVDLTRAYIERINEVNPTLHAVTEINPDAIAIAKELDLERRLGKTRGPLHGLPMLVKMNIGTDDKMNTTAGSFALLGAKLPRDSTMAAKLRKAGVILLGKSNLSQWANFRSSNSSNGWSAYGGQVTGAYFPNQDPSGSSSGSGVSSSIGLAFATLGTETDGSILSPSETNNLVGIKPSVGLTSRSLVIPISQHQDTVGPMARSVKDAAHILSAIAGFDPADNWTSAIPFKKIPDYAAACKLNGLNGARIGVPRNVLSGFGVTSGVIFNAFEAALTTIASAGATVVENATFTAFDQFVNSNNETTVLDVDFVSDLKNYLDQLVTNPNNITSLASLAAFTTSFPPEDFPDRDISEWVRSLSFNFTNTDAEFFNAYQADLFLAGEGGILGALKRNNLDAVVVPTEIAPGLIAIAGLPGVTVPLGALPNNTRVRTTSRGLVEDAPNIPFGLSFLGRAFSEEKLISFAYAFEQRTLVRDTITPFLVPTTQLTDVMNR